jgi:hypothetical protein
MAELDGELRGHEASAGTSGSEERGRERRERAMAEAALTLAEIGNVSPGAVVQERRR